MFCLVCFRCAPTTLPPERLFSPLLLPSIEVNFRAQKKTPISSHLPSPRHTTCKQKRWCDWGLEGSALIALEMNVADKQTGNFFQKSPIITVILNDHSNTS
uniref:(northern house mosquito) hypothetical protein n=1 Tax=Culex pipiens TaxID=7175 RepID=A0A8D8I3H4_CULPI